MEQNTSLFSLTIDPVTKAHLHDISRWARFLALVGMLFLLLGLVVSILDATMLNNTMGMSVIINGSQSGEVTQSMRTASAIGSLIVTALVFFPLYFLLLFSNKMKKALAANQQKDLNEAFQNLKKHFRYLGILVICCLLLFALVFVLFAVLGVTA
jgi:hypothetical protein